LARIQNKIKFRSNFSLINTDNDKTRLEREVDEMRKQLSSIESLLREVLNQQKPILSYSRYAEDFKAKLEASGITGNAGFRDICTICFFEVLPR
jgi:hypothetical protein